MWHRRTTKRKLVIPWRWAVLVLLTVYLAVTLFWLIQDLVVYRSAGLLVRRHSLSEILRPRPAAGHAVQTMPVDAIQDWMTFDYLNQAYGLDPGFLRRRLSIDDPQYPNVSIEAHAERAGENRNVLLEQTKKAVQDELRLRSLRQAPTL